jgi:tetratricopeptide (TPR) repeat protein
MADALANSGTTNELSKMSEVHLYLGDLFQARGDHTKARGHYDRVIELSQSVGQFRTGIMGLIRHAYVAFSQQDEETVYARLTEAMEQAQAVQDQESELQIRAHIIYTQLLTHGFRARGDTFSSLLNSSDELNLNKAAVLCYLFKADVAAARGEYSEARDLLRYAQIGAAQIGDYAMVIPIARRNYLIQKELGQLGDPHIGAGHAIGALIPPEVGVRRFKELPRAVD